MYIHVGIKYWLKVVLLLFSINANGSNTTSYNLRGSYTIHNILQTLEIPSVVIHIILLCNFYIIFVRVGGEGS